METRMSDSMREAANNPAFRLVAWAGVSMVGVVISMGTYIFTRSDTDTQAGRAELTQSIKDLRTDLQSFSRTLQDQQASMMLMQSRVANLETISSTTRDNLSKVRDEVQRDAFRIDRLEEVTNTQRHPAARGAR